MRDMAGKSNNPARATHQSISRLTISRLTSHYNHVAKIEVLCLVFGVCVPVGVMLEGLGVPMRSLAISGGG